MPSLFAASITVPPLRTCTALPSISRFNMRNGRLFVRRDDTRLVIDVILEFRPKMLDEALHRQRRGVAERTNRPTLDVIRDGGQHVEVFLATFAVLDSIDHPPEPAGAFAAWRALATRFLEVEIR